MRIAVLGGGAWGTAMALVAAGRHEVALFVRDPAQAEAVRFERENRRYLPGFRLPAELLASADLSAVLANDPELIVVATPTSGLRAAMRALAQHHVTAPVLWLCKGFERDTGLLGHQIAAQELGAHPAGVLSGPSFAQEVAAGLPTALTVAGSGAVCDIATVAFHAGALRVYATDDLTGVEVGGAVKNVMAIATGIADALQLGNNARAALITRGLAEIIRFGVALGARAETFMGLAGVGDLLLTCTGELSRNRQVGLRLGQGVPLARTLADIGHVAEGVWSAPEVARRAQEAGVDMPITHAVCAVLAGRLSPQAALELLLARDPRREGA
ncbi:MAG TPA: NAD(P)H-dependent glycerol-3-phosphate dehydrogenase [Burkholderiaceae bacterium]|nr:NAD(P)H-dependent glycerol-3-phosphate dehydrogenase [Burkholderiaceae bacterium]